MGAPRFVLNRFWPSNLFLGGIPGAWYDPTDLSTMFQDSTGTTPVTAVEQPVGLILDKSQGLANGPELSPNIGPYTNTTDWTGINSAVLSATGGELLITAGNTYSGAYITANVVAGTWLDVTIVARRGTATAAYVSILNQTNTVIVDGFGNPSLAIGATNTTVRTRFLVPAGMTQARLLVIHDNQAVGRTLFCSSASARTLAGNHASQSTAASRPTYRARYNAATYSEDFGNAAWAKQGLGTGGIAPTVATNTVSAPDGTTTADTISFGARAPAAFNRIIQTTAQNALDGSYTMSVYMRVPSGTALVTMIVDESVLGVVGVQQTVTVTSSWQRFTITGSFTGKSASFVRLVLAQDANATQAAFDVYVWGAQLLTAADVTATGNAYQRIAAATVYDTAPIFRPYLAFDGVDDSLSTAAINFTSTDKMSVFAGMTKVVEQVGCFAELSADTNANAGSFYMFNSDTAAAIGFKTRGTVNPVGPTAAYAAPVTRVVTGLGDITAPSIVIRLNGSVAASNANNQGVGNFGNYPLFIGRRNNTSFPFNGRLYELIVRGAASSVTEIADTELWVNARTGGY